MFANIIKNGDCKNDSNSCKCEYCIKNFFGEVVICIAGERQLFVYLSSALSLRYILPVYDKCFEMAK